LDPSPYDAGFGVRLRELREARGYSQTEFADRLGVSRRRYQDYEAGARPPDVRIKDMARRLRVRFSWLAHGALLVFVLFLAANIGCALGAWRLPEPVCILGTEHAASVQQQRPFTHGLLGP
jgi:transcriptional regulator with XRE-family HTH domain